MVGSKKIERYPAQTHEAPFEHVDAYVAKVFTEARANGGVSSTLGGLNGLKPTSASMTIAASTVDVPRKPEATTTTSQNPAAGSSDVAMARVDAAIAKNLAELEGDGVPADVNGSNSDDDAWERLASLRSPQQLEQDGVLVDPDKAPPGDLNGPGADLDALLPDIGQLERDGILASLGPAKQSSNTYAMRLRDFEAALPGEPEQGALRTYDPASDTLSPLGASTVDTGGAGGMPSEFPSLFSPSSGANGPNRQASDPRAFQAMVGELMWSLLPPGIKAIVKSLAPEMQAAFHEQFSAAGVELLKMTAQLMKGAPEVMRSALD